MTDVELTSNYCRIRVKTTHVPRAGLPLVVHALKKDADNIQRLMKHHALSECRKQSSDHPIFHEGRSVKVIIYISTTEPASTHGVEDMELTVLDASRIIAITILQARVASTKTKSLIIRRDQK